MNLRFNSLAALSLVCIAGLGIAAAARMDNETEIKLADLPEAARAVVTKAAPASSIKKIVKETDEGVTVYEIEFTDAGVECSMDVSPTGDVLATERSVGQDKLPAPAVAALKLEFPGATMKDANIVVKTFYEVTVVIDGKMREVKVDAVGNIENESAGKDGDEKDGEKDGEQTGKKKDSDKK